MAGTVQGSPAEADDGAEGRATSGVVGGKGEKAGDLHGRGETRRGEERRGNGRTKGVERELGFWLRIVANHFNCARSSLEPLMASSVSDTAASGRPAGRRRAGVLHRESEDAEKAHPKAELGIARRAFIVTV